MYSHVCNDNLLYNREDIVPILCSVYMEFNSRLNVVNGMTRNCRPYASGERWRAAEHAQYACDASCCPVYARADQQHPSYSSHSLFFLCCCCLCLSSLCVPLKSSFSTCLSWPPRTTNRRPRLASQLRKPHSPQQVNRFLL